MEDCEATIQQQKQRVFPNTLLGDYTLCAFNLNEDDWFVFTSDCRTGLLNIKRLNNYANVLHHE